MVKFLVAGIAFFALIIYLEWRAHKRDPGADQRLGEVDDDLTAKGM